MKRTAALLVLALAACGGSDAPLRANASDAGSAASLIDNGQWEPVSAEADPLAQHRPSEVVCPQGAYLEEDGALEVQTGYCNYLAVAQPVLDALRAGDVLRIVLWHDRLVADPAEAHAALWLGDEVTWEREVAIPSDAAVYDEEIVVERDVPRGTRVGFHLHNHGYNAWSLVSIERHAR